MATGSFGGTSTSLIGNTQNWVHVGGVTLPAGRNQMTNGTFPALVTSMAAYASGDGASRTIQLGFEGHGYTSGFGVGAASSAQYTGQQSCSFFSYGGTDTFRIASSGQFFFGRGGSGGPSTDSFGRTFSNILYGDYVYLSAPSVPVSVGVVAAGSTSATVSWGGPIDTGDTTVTGYRLDYSTSPTFTSFGYIEVGNVSSYTITALAASTTYYFRVLAENVVTTLAGDWGLPSSTVSLTTGSASGPPTATYAMSANVSAAFTYPTSSVGCWSFWAAFPIGTSWFFTVKTAGRFGGADLNFGIDPTSGFWASTSTAANPISAGPAFMPTGGFASGSHHFSVGVAAVFASGTWTFPLTLYVDGVQVATGNSTGYTPPATFTNAAKQPTLVQVGTLGLVGPAVISRIAHTLTLPKEYLVSQGTEAGAFAAIAAATPQVSLGPLPTDLSTAPIGYVDAAQKSTLDVLNLTVRTEQGYLDTATTGSLTRPTQTVRVRSRQRPAAVAYSFDAQTEVLGEIDFLRDVTDLVWSDVVQGANSSSLTVSQAALQARAGSNNGSDTVAVYQSANLHEWGTDRLWRGQNISLRPATVTIDNLSCPTDRSSDLLQMVPGDRISITNIPSATLGFTTWDGWLLDKAQSHRSGANAQDQFTLYMQPCQPATGIYDTDLWANDSNLTISTGINAAATTLVCSSGDGNTFFDQGAVPYTLQLESEQVTVTAAAAPSGSTQSLTITRSVNGTTAAAHAVGVAPEVTSNSIYAF